MNSYLEPQGFLGTGASLLADLTLVAYLLLIVPAMIVGYVFARRGKHRPHHKWIMTAITAVNWILIVFLMFAAYRFDVAGNIGTQPTNARYLLPVLHGLLGIPAQLLATFIILRMLTEDWQVGRARRRGEKDTSRYWYRSAKPAMRIALVLWLATATLGVFSYLTRYEVLPAYASDGQVDSPVATEELLAPVETPEPPVATDEPDSPAETPEPPIATDELLPPVETEEVPARTLLAPVETEEAVEPVETPEAEDD